MNKILTVGHPNSGYRDVERMLHAYGMRTAKTSKREGLSPVEIGSVLRQAHGDVTSDSISKSDEIRQIEAGPVWHGLALDLLMNNIDQKFWGWSDPEAIYLLDYWKSLDPKIAFLLVYDEPHRVLTESACDEARLCNREIIEQRLDNWNAYNGALLGFYLRNMERCLLVNAKQARKQADVCLNEIKPYLEDQLLLSGSLSDNNGARGVSNRDVRDSQNNILSREALAVPALADGFLIDSILVDYPEHLQRFEELQSAATIPLQDQPPANHNPLDAWLIHMKRRSETGRFLAILSDAKQQAEKALLVKEQEVAESCVREKALHDSLTEENEFFLAQLCQTEEKLKETEARLYLESEQNTKLNGENAADKRRQKDLEEEKADLEQKLKEQEQQVAALEEDVASKTGAERELKEENELLLSQLHQVQEELERHYLENEKHKGLEAEKDELEKKRQVHEQEIDDLKAKLKERQVQGDQERADQRAKQKAQEEQKTDLERKLKEQEQQVAALEKDVASKTGAERELKEENELLLSQLHQVQEELERHYLENEKHKGLEAEKDELEKKRQAHEQEIDDLKAKLKERQVQGDQERVDQRVKQKAQEEQKMDLERKLKEQEQQVAALEKDVASKTGAERELKEENELLLSQLHQVQEELERHYLENHRLRQAQQPAYYGAADRLKSELPYQLGAAMIERSRKIWPVLFLPISLSRIAHQYRKKENQSDEKLPPLEAYRDFEAAEKTRKHLSYRLGDTWLNNSRTPWGWVIMPFALTKARRGYLEYRKSLGK